jgi:RNA polymerase sigma-70 factor (ECF subfamily)
MDHDGDLVRRARSGDSSAADDLACRYRKAAYLTAFQLLRNREDALDAAQDAFIRFFTHLHKFDCGRPVRPWLLRIVRNCARDLQRRGRVRKADSLDTGGWEGNQLEVVDPGPAPSRAVERHELQELVWKAMQEISEAHREILVLRDYQDLSYAEIAEVLDIPIGTVMSRLHAARRRLRACIAPLHPSLGGGTS